MALAPVCIDWVHEGGSALSVVVAEVPKNTVLRLGFTSFGAAGSFLLLRYGLPLLMYEGIHRTHLRNMFPV